MRPYRSGAGSQGSNHDNSNSLHDRRRSATSACRQPQPAGRQCDRSDFHAAQLASKQLELLGERPKAVVIGVFMNPNAAANAEPQIRELQAAAKALGLRLRVLNVGSEGEANTAFATLVAQRAAALFVTADGFFRSRLRDPIVALAARHGLPTMYAYREFVASGGLISYTSSPWTRSVRRRRQPLPQGSRPTYL
jgi:hypothetical protein